MSMFSKMFGMGSNFLNANFGMNIGIAAPEMEILEMSMESPMMEMEFPQMEIPEPMYEAPDFDDHFEYEDSSDHNFGFSTDSFNTFDSFPSI